MAKIGAALKPGGILYVSFKYGLFSGYRNERYFTDLTELSLHEILKEVPHFKEIETYQSNDVRVGRQDEKWLNAVIE
jgi:hypothetical protein